MALNQRQVNFMANVKEFASTMQKLYGLGFNIKESHAEEFDDAQEHSLLTDTADLEAAYFMDSTDVKTFVNQAVQNFLDYWTGLAVTTREYGKDVRRVL